MLQADENAKPGVVEEPPARRTRQNATPLSDFSSADLARALSGLSSQGQRTRDRALVVRGTIRSGETVEHHGDLVVLGDVNPGSEVLADGDIVVMGSLKGLPHAGAAGDNKGRRDSAGDRRAPPSNRGGRGARASFRFRRRQAAQAGQHRAATHHSVHTPGKNPRLAIRRAIRQIHERGTV